jgi:alpha-ketoglutarate-dependent taurine dioxygenase
MRVLLTDVWAEGVGASKATPAGNLSQPTHKDSWHFDYIFRTPAPNAITLSSVAIEPQKDPVTTFWLSDHFPSRAVFLVQ